MLPKKCECAVHLLVGYMIDEVRVGNIGLTSDAQYRKHHPIYSVIRVLFLYYYILYYTTFEV